MGTSIDYGTVSHETIYNCITGGAGSAGLADAGQGWQDVALKLQELQDLVDQAVQEIAITQLGAAADAATNAALALTLWISDGVAAASGIAARVAEQAGAFTYTRDNMPPVLTVPEVSFSQDPQTWLGEHAVEWLPGIQTGHEQALVEAQQAEQRARELMNLYQGISNDNLMIDQRFTTAPAVVAELAEPSLDGAGSGGLPGGLGGQPGLVHLYVAHTGSPAVGSSAGALAATAQQPVSSVVHQAVPPAPTSPQLVDGYPSPVDQPAAGAGVVRPGAVPSSGLSPVMAGLGAVDEDRVRGGSRSSGGGSFSGGGSARRGGGFGPRPSAAFSTAFSAGDSRLGGAAALDSSAPGNPVQSSTEPAGAGRAARGGAGWAGVPLGATSSSGPAERPEHRRPSYLIEQDTSAIVGELPLVAPPVIGAGEGHR